MSTPNISAGVEHALATLRLEAESIIDTHRQLIQDTALLRAAISAVLACVSRHGHVVVTGMGKSGHIGRKISATLASTGTPSFFLHPAEAAHGDLGRIGKNDMLLALSFSGESAEVVALLPAIKRLGIPMISITGNAQSSLASAASIPLTLPISQEACPHNLAPTSSTTVQLAIGDAIAMGVLVAMGFRAEDFARFHPGGALGKRLITVAEVMHHGRELPMVDLTTSFAETLAEMTRGGLGITVIVEHLHDNRNTIRGIFTDGDLRRLIGGYLKGAPFPSDNADSISSIALNRPIGEFLKPHPVTIKAGALAAQALAMMEEKRINQLLVVDDEAQLLGIITMHDLLINQII